MDFRCFKVVLRWFKVAFRWFLDGFWVLRCFLGGS